MKPLALTTPTVPFQNQNAKTKNRPCKWQREEKQPNPQNIAVSPTALQGSTWPWPAAVVGPRSINVVSRKNGCATPHVQLHLGFVALYLQHSNFSHPCQQTCFCYKGLTSTSLMLKDVGICAITSSPSRFLHRTQGISLDRHMAHFATAFVSCHQLSSWGVVSKVPVIFFLGWAQKIKHISVSKQLHSQETILHSPPLHDNSETTFCVRELA